MTVPCGELLRKKNKQKTSITGHENGGKIESRLEGENEAISINGNFHFEPTKEIS